MQEAPRSFSPATAVPVQAGSLNSLNECAEQGNKSQHVDPSACNKDCTVTVASDNESDASSSSFTLRSHSRHGAANRRKRMRKNRDSNKPLFLILLLIVLLLIFVLFGDALLFLLYHEHWSAVSGERHPEKTIGASSPTQTTTPEVGVTETPTLANPWIHAAIDMKAVPLCARNLEKRSPCRTKDGYITSGNALYPLRCVDDTYLANTSAIRNNCNEVGKSLLLQPHTGRIRILVRGLFLIFSKVTIRMREASEVHFGVAVNNEHLAFLCSVSSSGVTGLNQSAPYTQCSVQGVRRLEAGDEVWLFSPQSGVPLQSLYRSTYIQLARLGD